jgi:alpha-L-rhamnosidase
VCSNSTITLGTLTQFFVLYAGTPLKVPVDIVTDAGASVAGKVQSRAWVVDVGENIAGWCRYSFQSPHPPAGTNITFMHGEDLNGNGTITHYIQAITNGAYEQTTYIFGDTSTSTTTSTTTFSPAEGAAVFEPQFVSYGFRYVQLTGPLAAAPTLDNIICWSVHTDLVQHGNYSFAAATDATMAATQAGLNANYAATIKTAAANYISFPTDCPHRERRGWLGDAQAAAESLHHHFDMAASYTKWLDDVRNAGEVFYSNGDFPTLAPQYVSNTAYERNTSANPIAWSVYVCPSWFRLDPMFAFDDVVEYHDC